MVEIPVEYLRRVIHHDPATGVLKWKFRPRALFPDNRSFGSWNTRCAGKPALVSITRDGYFSGEVVYAGKRRYLLAHRVMFVLANGFWPAEELDHINGIRSDNRLDNLREATRQQNNHNIQKRSRFLTGVRPCKAGWMASIHHNKARFQIGPFTSERLAHAAYMQKKIELCGEFAVAASRLSERRA